MIHECLIECIDGTKPDLGIANAPVESFGLPFRLRMGKVDAYKLTSEDDEDFPTQIFMGSNIFYIDTPFEKFDEEYKKCLWNVK